MVVGPRCVSTSPAFVRSSARHPVGPHVWLALKRSIGHSSLRGGARGIDTICTAVCQNRCDSYTACRLCRLKRNLYISLITTVSFLYTLNMSCYFYTVSFLCVYISINFPNTLCMYAMCLTSWTDYFDDKTVSITFDLNILLNHRH